MSDRDIWGIWDSFYLTPNNGDRVISNGNKSYSLTIPIPGFKKSDVSIKTTGTVLTVTAKNKSYGERLYKYGVEGITVGGAKLEDGILTIKLSDKAQADETTISVE